LYKNNQGIQDVVEARSISETPVNFYQTTRRSIPEDGHLHTRRRKNLKSHTHPMVLLDLGKIVNDL
jgi:hypothetical protein